MRTFRTALIFCLLCCSTSAMAAQRLEPLVKPVKPGETLQLSPAPRIQPETAPVHQNPGAGSPLSTDAAVNRADYMQYEPYNVFPRELDLWNLEGKRMVRSEPVVSPDKTFFAYSETLFMPNVRQTLARLYLVPLPPPPPPPAERLPSEQVMDPAQPVDPKVLQANFDPARTMRIRQSVAMAGYDQVKPFDFRTFTVVDWSASGRRLLFKQRSGVLHVGLRTSDILIHDQSRGTVTIYPEIHRIIKHHWTRQGNLPHIEQLAWDIQPIGWETGSDAIVLLKAWAFDKNEKKFLGLWQYDVDAERTQLLSLEDNAATVAANGWLARPLPIPPQPDPRKLDWPWRQKPAESQSIQNQVKETP